MSTEQAIFDIVIGAISLFGVIMGIVNQQTLARRRQIILSQQRRKEGNRER